jgi:hypothetical protein
MAAATSKMQRTRLFEFLSLVEVFLELSFKFGLNWSVFSRYMAYSVHFKMAAAAAILKMRHTIHFEFLSWEHAIVVLCLNVVKIGL